MGDCANTHKLWVVAGLVLRALPPVATSSSALGSNGVPPLDPAGEEGVEGRAGGAGGVLGKREAAVVVCASVVRFPVAELGNAELNLVALQQSGAPLKWISPARSHPKP